MSTLRIATLNCLNLARPGVRVYPAVNPYTQDEYRAKVTWLAAQLDRLDADIIALQEVFHASCLADVVTRMASSDGWAWAAPLADAQNLRPRLAMMWRQELALQIESWADMPEHCAVQVPELGWHAQYSRPMLCAALSLAGIAAPLRIVNVHLKSRRPRYVEMEDPSCPQTQARGQLRSLIMRAAEAAALRHWIVQARVHRPAPLVVVGDFNDADQAATTRLVSDPLWHDDEAGAASGLRHRLRNALELCASAETGFTHCAGGRPERIDHIYVSEEFAADGPSAWAKVCAVQTLDQHLGVALSQAGQSARQSPSERLRTQSDHAAVCVGIEFGEA